MKKYIFYCFLSFCLHADLCSQSIPCVNGMAGDYPCENIDLLAHLPLSAIGGVPGARANDIWGWTDSESDRKFAIIGLTSGTSFIEISDSLNPIYLGFLPTHTSNSSWRDMKTYDNKVYIVSEAGGHGIQVFDLTRLLTVQNPPLTFTEDDHHPSLGGSAHNIVGFPEIGYMVLVGSGNNTCGKGFDFYSVSGDSIFYDNCYGASTSPYTHDGVCFIYKGPDQQYAGREICIGSNGNRGGTSRQVIIDITDKEAIEEISATSYPLQSYTHQSWITDDHRYLIINDELDEIDISEIQKSRTHIMDIQDLDDPKYLGFYEHDVSTIDHNVYVQGQYAYESNYESGLRILDISQIQDTALNLVAYFDTYINDSNSFNFNGAWSNYPFYSNGIVAVSDIQGGLFLLKPNLPHFLVKVNHENYRICPNDKPLEIELAIQGMHNFAEDVSLSIVDLPPGIMASLSDTMLLPGESTIMTMETDKVSPGQYTGLIKASDNSGNKEHQLAFRIEVADVSSIMEIQDETLSGMQTILGHDSISISNLIIDNNADIELISPTLVSNNNIQLKTGSVLKWKEQDGCTVKR